MSSTVASAKQSARMIQRRGSVFLARSDVGGRIDFGSPAGNGGTRPSPASEDGIEMERRIGIRQSSMPGRISRRNSGAKIDTDDTNLKGGSDTGRINMRFVSANETSAVGRVETKRMDTPVTTTGLASTVRARFSGSPSLRPLPAQARQQKARFHTSDGDNAESDGTTNHADSHEKPTHLASETPAQRECGAQAAGVEVKDPGRNGEQPESCEEHQAEEGRRNFNVAARTCNIWAQLPLSKIKIVIGKLSRIIRQIMIEKVLILYGPT